MTDANIHLEIGAAAGAAVSALDKTADGAKRLQREVDKVSERTNILGRIWNRVWKQIRNSLAFYVRFRIFSVIYRGIDLITGAIPELLRRGDEWLSQLERIQTATGMTAEQTSMLAFAARWAGIRIDKFSRDLSYLARNVIQNEDALKEYGIRVRKANGELKSAWGIFQEVRQALSEYGRQFLTTAAAQKLFSEGGRELINLLTLTKSQWRALREEAERAGAIFSQAAIDSAEAWRRAQNLMHMQIDVLGAQILGGIAPVLAALTTGVTRAIQDNMTNIVHFVQRVVVVIAGLVSGLFGIDIDLVAFSKNLNLYFGAQQNVTKGTQRLKDQQDGLTDSTNKGTRAVDRRVAALDKQIARLDRLQDRRKARREYEDLQQDVREAREELDELRTKAILESGMSAVEAELARQAHAADIIEAEEKLAEARKRRRDWLRDQEIQAERDRLQALKDALSKRLAATTAAAAAGAKSFVDAWQGVPDKITKGFKKIPEVITEELRQLIEDTALFGTQIREYLFGREITVPIQPPWTTITEPGGAGTGGPTRRMIPPQGPPIPGRERTPGLFGRILEYLQSAQKLFQDLETVLRDLLLWLQTNVPDLPSIPDIPHGEEVVDTAVGILTGETRLPVLDISAHDVAMKGPLVVPAKIGETIATVVGDTMREAFPDVFGRQTQIGEFTKDPVGWFLGAIFGGHRPTRAGEALEVKSDDIEADVDVDKWSLRGAVKIWGDVGVSSWTTSKTIPVSVTSGVDVPNNATAFTFMIDRLRQIRDHLTYRSYSAAQSLYWINQKINKLGSGHSGIHNVPQTGSYFLKRGETVLTEQQAKAQTVHAVTPTDITIMLDRKQTRDLFMGRPVTSSLRPATGT